MATKTLALLLLLNFVFCACVSASCPPLTPTPVAPSTPTPVAPSTPTPVTPTPAAPTPTSPKKKYGKCPVNTLKLGACVNLVNGLVNLVAGKPPSQPCCSVLKGLVGLDVAVCLCTAIKASVVGIAIDIPVTLSLLVNTCGQKIPSGYKSSGYVCVYTFSEVVGKNNAMSKWKLKQSVKKTA
ncbi:14 kDa proline-rich protein DC2.15-like [Aristolochia californica]|uniref:14 kDa proline-rich protein DC2.15-like n=1 Tax=Aristolochia californica TaxID=171875 RepID=UPI0035DFFFD9